MLKSKCEPINKYSKKLGHIDVKWTDFTSHLSTILLGNFLQYPPVSPDWPRKTGFMSLDL